METEYDIAMSDAEAQKGNANFKRRESTFETPESRRKKLDDMKA